MQITINSLRNFTLQRHTTELECDCEKHSIYIFGSSEESVGPPWLRQVSHRMIQGDFSGFKRPKTVCLSGSQFQLVV